MIVYINRTFVNPSSFIYNKVNMWE